MRQFLRIIVIGAMLFFGGLVQAKGSLDYKAGYNDGCSSSRGHYTRSAYKYKNSKSYHKGWRKGKRSCVKRKRTKRKARSSRKHYVKSCNTESPWVAFQRGWDDGYSSAKGRYRRSSRGCAAYRHGWVSGYRSCHCSDKRKAHSYTEGYNSGCISGAGGVDIKDEGYYRSSSKYRKGWNQGYRDCWHTH